MSNLLSKITLGIDKDLKNLNQVHSDNDNKNSETNIILSITAILAFTAFISFLCMANFWKLEKYEIIIHSVATATFYISIAFIKKSKLSNNTKIHLSSIMISLEYILLFIFIYDKIYILYFFTLLLTLIPVSTFSTNIPYIYIFFVFTIDVIGALILTPKMFTNHDLVFFVTGIILFVFVLASTYFVFILYNITMNKYNQKENELFELAYRDPLTKLYNRRFSTLKIKELIEKNTPFDFIYFDLDNFKIINDALNHDIGDKVIKELAKRFSESIKDDAMLFRMGGDEFACIVSKEFSKMGVEEFLSKLFMVLRNDIIVENKKITVTASFGIAKYPNNAHTSENILRAADAAMYTAKEMNDNSVYFYQEALENELMKKIKIESALSSAIENNEFYLVFQPIIPCKNSKDLTFEALLRWKSKELGSISPATFIPIAENLGIIHDVGYWVLNRAIETLARIESKYGSNFKISINISALQITKEDFVEDVEELVKKHAVSAENIIFEFTETVFMDDSITSQKVIKKLNRLGIKTAIDDFGTGYSSFGYLSGLKMNYLKIDKLFVDNIGPSEKANGIIKSIIGVGHNLDMKVTAEGVETNEQADLLLNSDCDFIQGFYYSKPLLEEELDEYIKNYLLSQS